MNQRFSAQALTRKTHHECRPWIMHFDKFIRPPVGARFIAPTADLSALWMFQYPGYFVKNYTRGAIGAKKNLFLYETYLKQIAANEASGAGSRPGIEKICCKMKHT